MRRVVGAVVVMVMIGAWNLAGRGWHRPGPADSFPPVVSFDATPVPRSRPPAPSVPRPAPTGKNLPPALPESFRTDPLVFLSSAPPESLDLLPGVGPVLAARLVDARRARGSFASWDDVLAVRGIGPRTIARWRSAGPRQ